MININFNYKHGKVVSFSMSGHADFAEHGSDIVCAGASAVSFGLVNSIYSLTDVEPILETDQEGGYLYCEIPADISADSSEKVQLLLEAMLVSLQTIERDYGNHIKINLKK
ncbi:MAG: ribosomal-processing cysteine protease Prp [Bacillus sp. (in: firmicutes)]